MGDLLEVALWKECKDRHETCHLDQAGDCPFIDTCRFRGPCTYEGSPESDAIAALQAENELMTASLLKWAAAETKLHNENAALTKRLEEAEAERDRLHKLLYGDGKEGRGVSGMHADEWTKRRDLEDELKRLREENERLRKYYRPPHRIAGGYEGAAARELNAAYREEPTP